MPLPLLLGATMPWWAPWLTAAAGSWAGLQQLQKGRVAGEKERAPSQRVSWLTPITQAQKAMPGYGELSAYRQGVSQYGISGAGKPPVFTTTIPPDKKDLIKQVPPPNGIMSYYDANGNLMTWNGADDYIQTGFDPSKIYQEDRKPTIYPQYGTNPYDDPLTTAVEGQWNPYKGQWEPDLGLTLKEQRMAEGRAETAREREREWEAAREDRRLAQQYQIQQQQMAQSQAQFKAQLEAQHQQRLATLASQPMSWLQYAAESGTQPAVQPWMLPLMPQQYSQLQAGSAIPGYQGGAPSQPYTTVNTGLTGNPLTGSLQMGYAYTPSPTPGAISMTGMPQLTQPSRQYQARMGPTAGAQYAGYEQARTGATPEELQWRMWSQAPPSGRFSRLAWSR